VAEEFARAKPTRTARQVISDCYDPLQRMNRARVFGADLFERPVARRNGRGELPFMKQAANGIGISQLITDRRARARRISYDI